MQKKLIYGLITAAVLVTAIVFGVNGGNTTTATEAPQNSQAEGKRVTRQVEASGVLEAQAYARLMWKTSGTIERATVKVGDQVKAGDILTELQIGSVATNIITAQADLVDAKKALDDVLKSNLSQANAKLELAAAQEALDDAQNDYALLNRPRVSAELIEQTEDDLQNAQDQLKRIKKFYDRFLGYEKMDSSRYAKSDLTLKLLSAQENVDRMLAKLNWYTSTPSQTSLMQSKAALDLALARVEDAKREVQRLSEFPNADDVTAAQARVDAAQSTVNSLYILAPFDGEVLSIEQNPGDTVSAGATALLLANRSQLHVNAQVVEIDVSHVKVGNLANVTLDSIPGRIFTGRVTLIEPVGRPIAGLIKFNVRIDLDPVDDEAVLLGGTANVTILVDEP